MKLLFLTKILPTLVLVVALQGLALAQEPAPIGGPGPLSPTSVPLDGGASLLLAGGIGYGLKKLRERRAAK